MGMGAFGLLQGGPAVWIGFGSLFVVIPVLEYISRSKSFDSAKFNSLFADVSLFLTPLVLSVLLFLALHRATLTKETFELSGIVFSTGTMLGAFGINSAHEMVHRREKFVRALGVYNLALVNFAHWGLEHVFGHHKYVATPLDTATARKDEALYPFWFRNYFGTLRGAWHISKNKVLMYWSVSVVLTGLLCYFAGAKIVIIWWSISVVATLLLLTVDYLEHYALERPKKSEGNYMAVKAHHSWDSSSILTNITLFNLGFHSHHHMKAIVHFKDLVAQESAKKMPYGYSVMLLMALVPWIYIPFMNKRVT